MRNPLRLARSCRSAIHIDQPVMDEVPLHETVCKRDLIGTCFKEDREDSVFSISAVSTIALKQIISIIIFFFFNNPPTPEISTLPLHAALPISPRRPVRGLVRGTDQGQRPGRHQI